MQPAFSLEGNRARNDVAIVVQFKTCLLHFITQGFCDSSGHFHERIMATNNSGLNSTYLLIGEEQRKREKRQRARINRPEAAKRILVENLCSV